MSGNTKTDHGITVTDDGTVDVVFETPVDVNRDDANLLDTSFDIDAADAAATATPPVTTPPVQVTPTDTTAAEPVIPPPPAVDPTQLPEFIALREEVNNLTAQREAEAQQRANEEAVRQRVASINTQLAEKQTQLAAAIDKGEIQAQTSILMEIQGLQLDLRLANIAATTPPAATTTRQPTQPAQPKAPVAQPAEPPQVTKDWVKRNPWFQRPGYEKYSKFAASVDRLLTDSGEQVSAKYFEKLDAMLHQQFPELRPQTTPPATAVTAPAVAAATRTPAAVTPTATPKSYRLTKADLETMEVLGLDTRNPQHLKRYAAEMAAAASTTQE